MLKLLRVLLAYRKARKHEFKSRTALERHQEKELKGFLDWLTENSLYFSGFRRYSRDNTTDRGAVPLAQFPLMDKDSMMANFDEMNTAHLPLQAIMDLAQSSEASRDFQGTLEGYTVGLSSGTSAKRGAFIVSESEKAQWAGTILAKLLPAGLFAGERVALFLRADSGLYQTVKSPWLTFRFFDLVSDFTERTHELADYAPSILVAPAQVLRQLALEVMNEGLVLAPKKIVSVAEVLEPQDRDLIERVFGQSVHQVYQATEGFLGSTCEVGTLHLNEEFLHVEKEWIDKEARRFVPIITDFTRRTQPIVRYRLNDVLVAKKYPCSCGRVTQAVEAVEGRCDDMLILRKWNGEPLPIFADALSRILAQELPWQADYRLAQVDELTLKLDADVPEEELVPLRGRIVAKLAAMGAVTDILNWQLSNKVPDFNPSVKRRRITRTYTST